MKAPIHLSGSVPVAIALLATSAGVSRAQLPDPGMEVDLERTALVITDPQNDFLSPDGVTWGGVGESVTENNTVENIESLLAAAKKNGISVFISPHYYYPTDHGWQFRGALEALMLPHAGVPGAGLRSGGRDRWYSSGDRTRGRRLRGGDGEFPLHGERRSHDGGSRERDGRGR
jgi:hypothetical protein